MARTFPTNHERRKASATLNWKPFYYRNQSFSTCLMLQRITLSPCRSSCSDFPTSVVWELSEGLFCVSGEVAGSSVWCYPQLKIWDIYNDTDLSEYAGDDDTTLRTKPRSRHDYEYPFIVPLWQCYILVMQCFRVVYREISHKWLDFFLVYTRDFRQVCTYKEKSRHEWDIHGIPRESKLHN